MAISKRSILNSLQRPVTAVAVLGVLVLVTVGVRARVWRNSSPAATSQQQLLPTPRGPAQIVRFTVYDAGIFPREVRVKAGLVSLRMEDMSGGSAGLVVASESLQMVGQILRRPGRSRDNTRMSLVAGRYTVYDANRPMHRATLIVEP